MQIAWPYPIGKYRNRRIQVFFLFGEQTLPECVFNRVFLVNVCMIFLIVILNGYVFVTLIGV